MKASYFSFLSPLGFTLHIQGYGVFAYGGGSVLPLVDELTCLSTFLYLMEEESSPWGIEEAQR